jgi:hypothetical protein
VETGVGHTKYTLEDSFVYLIGGTLTDVSIKSELVFPIDMYSFGGEFNVAKIKDSITSFMFGAKVVSSFSDPRGQMTDRDWRNEFEFSSTESNTEIWSIRVATDIAGRVTGKKESGLFWVAGFQFERYSFDITDLTGWGMILDSIGQIVDSTKNPFSLDYQVLAYEVSWSMPYLGLMLHEVGQNVSLDFMGAFGMAIMSDQDYHLLRDFTTQSSGNGFGFISEADLMYRMPLGSGERGLKIGLSGSLAMANVNTTEDRLFYSDSDPGIDPVDIGLVLKGIPHEVKLSRFSFGLKLEYEL